MIRIVVKITVPCKSGISLVSMAFTARRRKQGGSGMGLALCQRIAAVHGGTLQISSQVGVGTAVTVTLPKEVQP